MPRGTGKRALLASVVCGGLVSLMAAPASAETFTVCASGCRFATITEANASASVHDGDELLVEPGTYNDGPTVTKVLAVHGDPSLPRPVLAPSGPSNGLTLGAGSAGSVVSHLALNPTDINASGVAALAPGTLSDLTIVAARSFAIGSVGVALLDTTATQTSILGILVKNGGLTLRRVHVSFPAEPLGVLLTAFDGPGTVIEDSSFTSPVANTPLGINLGGSAGQVTLHGVRVEGGGKAMILDGPATITDTLATAEDGSAVEVFKGGVLLRNVTAISSGGRVGAPSYGLRAGGCAGSSCTPGTISARDVIARGTEGDVQADGPEGSPGAAGAITIDHSNFVTSGGAVAASAVQSTNPLFVNGTVGPSENFRLLAGSPAIDAGVADAFLGTSDLDGNPRIEGAAVDLGAYEFVPPPPVSAAVPPPAPAPSPLAPAKPLPAKLTILGRTVKIDSRRGTGGLGATCSSSRADQCAVVGTVFASTSRGKSAASRKAPARLGTLTGTVAGGRSGRLTVRITAKALAGLRRLHRLPANFTATVTSAGGTTRLTGQLKLVPAAPAHKGKR